MDSLSTGKKKKLLIVDDLESIRATTREAFKFDFEIEDAGSGVEAIQKFERFKPDVVFLDLNLEGSGALQGRMVLEIMKARSPKTIICVISADASFKHELLELGADAFFEKPCLLDALIAFLMSKRLIEKQK